MRLIFVNSIHQRTPHVSGMRLYQFAGALARRGHKIVLITGLNPNHGQQLGGEPNLASLLVSHDWIEPLSVEVVPIRMRFLDAVRQNRLPVLLRKILTAWHFLVYGGVFADWTRPARPVVKELVDLFKPDLVWATFGNTSNLVLAQWAARIAECPWVMDVKDNWEAFVPAGLRGIMARRFRDAVGLTSNAHHHLKIAKCWHHQPNAVVVYSGVADCMFDTHATRWPTSQSERHLLLVGSTYSQDVLHDYLEGVSEWLRSLPSEDGGRFRLRYAGSDSMRVTRAIQSTGLSEVSRIDGQIPIEKLAELAHTAFACSYLWAPFGFHHKLLELLVVGNPVITFPGERRESFSFAECVATPFYVCKDRVMLRDALQRAWDTPPREARAGTLPPPWRWDDFAESLEAMMMNYCGARILPDAALRPMSNE